MSYILANIFSFFPDFIIPAIFAVIILAVGVWKIYFAKNFKSNRRIRAAKK